MPPSMAMDDFVDDIRDKMFGSLKGRAVAMQLLSAPIFIGAGMFSAQYSYSYGYSYHQTETAISMVQVPWPTSAASPATTAAWCVTLMLVAEGLGNAFLAYATWYGTSVASMSKEFVGEPERSRKWISANSANVSSSKDKPATPRSVIVTAVLSSLCFNVVIPFCRLLLCCWGLGAGPNAFRAAYAVSAFLLLEWGVWAATWKRPLVKCALLLLVGASLAAGYALYTKETGAGGGLHTHYWGLANLLYIGNFLLFPLGMRRWMLEITNIFIWILLGFGSAFCPQ